MKGNISGEFLGKLCPDKEISSFFLPILNVDVMVRVWWPIFSNEVSGYSLKIGDSGSKSEFPLTPSSHACLSVPHSLK